MKFKITDKDDPKKGPVVSPLEKLTAADLDPDDDLALRRAVKSGRLDWKAAFVLFLSFEELGEENSPRHNKLEDLARTLLAKELKVSPYSSECETAFQDQVAISKANVISKYYKSYHSERAKEVSASRDFTNAVHQWLEESLKKRDLKEEDFDSTVAELEDMGYFLAERDLDDGKFGVMPKDQAIAYLQSMFYSVPRGQKWDDRKHAMGTASKNLGIAAAKGVGGALLGFGKFYTYSMPKWMIKWGFLKPLHVTGKYLKQPLSPIKATKESAAMIKDSVGKSAKEAGQRTEAWYKERKTRKAQEKKDGKKGAVRTALGKAFAKEGDHLYAKRTENDAAKLKERAKLLSKRVQVPSLLLTDSPFIDPKKYMKAS